jgi:hypothetical protein
VHGLDASMEMLASAEKKARKSGIGVFFKSGVAEALPFPAAQFNVVLSTVMLHICHRKHGCSAQERFAGFSSRMDVCLSLTSRDSVIKREVFCLTFTVPTDMFARRISLPYWLKLA